jgi:hypothetical protein
MRTNIVNHIGIASRVPDKNGRPAHTITRRRTKNIALQLAQHRYIQRIAILPATLLHGGSKAAHTLNLTLFFFNFERSPAFLDRPPHCTAQQSVGAELNLEIVQRLPAVVLLQLLHRFGSHNDRAKCAAARQVVAHAPALYINGARCNEVLA